MSRILVTGIEGFAGGHLARHLTSAGHEVIGLHWADAPAGLPGELHRGDVCDFDATRALLETTKPDGIIHLAGISSVALSESRQMTTYEVNALGTLKLLEAVRQLRLKCRLVLISSADVYGRSNVGRALSEDLPSLPLSPYALSKHMTAEAGLFYHRAFGLDVVILRPFSHTGPGQTTAFVFPKVANAIARIERGQMEPVIVMGDLSVRRDYTDVRDVVRAYLLALGRCVAGETYNVTSGKPLMIREGVDYLCGLARVPVEISSSAAEFRPHDIPLLTGDPSKFMAATGWKPEIPFANTLSDLLDYYRGL
ncbi:NAD-dependent epimerase/dehydratase family protein [candidate division WOR-3 bacterium]|uniref:NAD-dependent epimerase/dehydratase family protein n=1 Tax=candidate division WOR-3 bacterium TaxID=2052148 RepID=A0A937XKB4_UNCW3|nr:NAD-dependent epimerase/dehydratase family protein [candidate division WOR-3 bacterium]